jgi:hypothetical protein
MATRSRGRSIRASWIRKIRNIGVYGKGRAAIGKVIIDLNSMQAKYLNHGEHGDF